MDETTELDEAHAAMEAAPEDDGARLRFYERLADSELFLVLDAEARGEAITPASFEVEDQEFVLVFDRVERLAGFVGEGADYAAMAGRALAVMLAGQRLGLGLNLAVAPSAMLIPAEAVDWLAATLARGPEARDAQPVEVFAPTGLPEAVVRGLDRKLALAAGMARWAWLAGVAYDDGTRSHLLAFVDALPVAQAALAAAVSEALTFSGIEAGMIDVAFIASSDPMAARLAKVGLRFDLPEPARAEAPGAPGMDPDRPPKLR
ncbi:MAG: SseB family protein [Limimaricola sp.]|uniref:SseB family protein n=1 Tax=Limimaricola sp. TaxID=2211665 RepID=UPI001D23F078|nr:SseB family protein [Limimaricola sp.]MBI1415778.1 SseB family protein [Limimaricola sp.]